VDAFGYRSMIFAMALDQVDDRAAVAVTRVARPEDTAATPAINCGWPLGSGRWSTTALPSTPRAASSYWKTSSTKPGASTPS
jgi:hypothetical protein